MDEKAYKDELARCLSEVEGRTKRDGVRLVSLSQPHASSFWSAPPTASRGLYLPSRQYQAVLRLRLGEPVVTPGTPCKNCLTDKGMEDGTGEHMIECMKGGDKGRVHNKLRDTIATFMRGTGRRVGVEETGHFVSSANRRPDIVAYGPPCAAPTKKLYDVTVTAPNAKSYTNLTKDFTPLAAAERAEKAKHDKYKNDLTAGATLVPLVFESYGAMSENTRLELTRVATLWGQRRHINPCVAIPHVFQRVSAALHISIAGLLTATDDTPEEVAPLSIVCDV